MDGKVKTALPGFNISDIGHTLAAIGGILATQYDYILWTQEAEWRWVGRHNLHPIKVQISDIGEGELHAGWVKPRG